VEARERERNVAAKVHLTTLRNTGGALSRSIGEEKRRGGEGG